MNTMRMLGPAMLFAAALAFTACKSTTVPADVGNAAQGEACNSGCDKAQSECVEKCKEDVNKEACEVACKAARDKCAEDCKKQ